MNSNDFCGGINKILVFKPLGGWYLIYLVYDWHKGKQTLTTEEDLLDKNNNWLYKATVSYLGFFLATVALVELIDMAFSIDNIFAAVAFTPKMILVYSGVFIEILAIQFIEQ